MTFTFDLSDGFDDIDRVRFWTGDTVEVSAMHTDEEIGAIVTEESDWQHAVVAILEGKIAQLSLVPDFKADWLEIDVPSTIAVLKDRLVRFQSRHSDILTDALRVGSEPVHTYRADSDATEVPDYG